MKNYSSSDVDKAIRKSDTGEISQVKAISKYCIPRRTLAIKFKNKRDNVVEKNPGLTSVLGGEAEKYLVQWALSMHKQVFPVGWDVII